MKHTIQIGMLCAMFSLMGIVNAQSLGNRTVVKSSLRTKVTPKLTTTERKCNPISIRSVENIMRSKVAKSLKITLDRDYGFVEVMGKRQNVRFDEYKVKKPGNNWKYYLNDVKSEITRVSYSKNRFILIISFEKERSEIKGKCPGCRIGNDKRAPDIQWNDPKVRVLLTPVAYNGSFTFQVDRVDLLGKFKLNGPSEKFFPSITRYFKGLIAKKVKSGIGEALNNSNVKNAMAKAFQPEVRRLNIGSVKNIDFSNNNIYLCNY